jgi:hypothetical protein
MTGQNFLAKKAESILGHDTKDRAATTDISNPDRNGGKYADPSGETMKALVWMGKNDVRMRMYSRHLVSYNRRLTWLLRGCQQAQNR